MDYYKNPKFGDKNLRSKEKEFSLGRKKATPTGTF